jgi:hypothetical protein
MTWFGRSAAAWLVVATVVVVGPAACAARRPVLYPNTHLESVGRSQADVDIAECQALAKDYIASGGVTGEAAVAGGTGAAVGGAGGAAAGAAWGGRAGRGAAAGAAGGATAGVLHTLFRRREPSEAHKNFVTRCLADRGYDVIGWQ